jgi:iron(III) transport system ATP-binding protein
LSFAIPGTVVGVSYILAFNVPPIEITGTGFILVMCFVFRNMPVGVRAGIATLSQIDKSLDEASLTLGARSATTMRRVVLPLLRPAIVASLVYSFVRAMTAVSAVIFLVTAEYNMATTYIVGRVEAGEFGLAIAYSTVLIAVMLVAIVGIQALVGERRLGRRAAPSLARCRSSDPMSTMTAASPLPRAHEAKTASKKQAASVEFRNVTKRYGNVTAVDDVSFTIEAGQLVTLLGPSGCGKTTTLRMIAGLEMASEGRILIGGRDVTHLSAADRDVSMVFQSYALFPHMSVLENVSYGPSVQGVPKKDAYAMAMEKLSLVGLSGLEKRAPSELSGGQQQRVAVARALVLEPQVLLFDEPLSNLDAKAAAPRARGHPRAAAEPELTVAYVTHDQEEALAVSDRIIVMSNARSRSTGAARALREPRASSSRTSSATRNILDGTVVEERGERGLVQIGTLTTELPRRGARPGSVKLAVRPDAFTVTDDPAARGLEGRVTKASYLGNPCGVRNRDGRRRAFRGGAQRTRSDCTPHRGADRPRSTGRLRNPAGGVSAPGTNPAAWQFMVSTRNGALPCATSSTSSVSSS